MLKYVVDIPSTKVRQPIRMQKLRVAAYCRVSTTYGEQQQCLDTQIVFYIDYLISILWRVSHAARLKSK